MKSKALQPREITRFSKDLHKDMTELLSQLSTHRTKVDIKSLKIALKDPYTKIYGIFDGKKLVAMNSLMIINTFAVQRGYINDLVVDKKYRNQGLGRILMDEVIRKAKKMKLLDLSLSSRPNKNTASFFKELGFHARDTINYRMNLSKT